MSANPIPNARIRVGQIEFEAPPDQFLELLRNTLIQIPALVQNANALTSSSSTSTASTPSTSTSTAAPATSTSTASIPELV